MNELIKRLKETRDGLVAKIEALAGTLTGERTSFEPDEQATYDDLKRQVQEIDERIGELRQMADAGDAAADALRRTARSVEIVREPRTYERTPIRNEDGSWRSFFADVYKAQRGADVEALDRLRRHAKEQADELERRKASMEAAVASWADELRIGDAGIEIVRMATPGVRNAERHMRFLTETRDLTRTDGAGGEFVPPLWLIDEYVPLARAGRVFADSFNVRPLPPGTDSINVPKVATGATVAPQTADNAAVDETDMTTTSIAAPVRTIAGQQDVAIQLLEQSPVAFDEVVFSDLIGAYNAQLDAQLINGSGAAGQLQGVLGLAGINAVTYTDASPTVAELYPKLADAVNQANTGRLLPPTRMFMHGRRWYWHTAAVDSQGRPLVVPATGGPTNAIALAETVAAEGGPVGVLQGIPVLIDPNIPINLGAGVNEDRIILGRTIDWWLWESFLRTRVLPEVGSSNLTVRLQLYNYAAATAARYPAGISVVSGTGLVTPTF